MKPFDLIVIGSGPAGQRGAIQAAKFGKRVALVEKENVFGGACIHTGTLPSKALRESIYNIFTFRLGSTELTRSAVREKVSFKELSARKDKVVQSENEMVAKAIRSNGVSVYEGFGSFVDSTHVKVHSSEGGELILEGKYFLIATGSRPVRPAQIPFDDVTICDSDSILNLKEIPSCLTVIGGGVIGCEYASMFAALGVEVHLVDKKNDILPFIDQEITEVLKKALISHGCKLYLGDEFVSIKRLSDGFVETTLKSGKTIKSSSLLYAMGRGAQTSKLNLKEVGVVADPRGQISVDKHYQTATENIYAVGDVIGFPSLASSSFEQGRLAVCHAFHIPHAEFPETFPYGIYTIPEISSVGKSEEDLINEKIEFEVGRAEYQETARGQIIADSGGLLKICFCPSTFKIFGIHVIGNSASELVHLGQMVMTLGGDMHTLVKNVFNYPTLAEAYKIAAFNGLNKVKKH
jgi:NAD(P) transhydrogenase